MNYREIDSTSPEFKKSYKFYDILRTRTGFYEALQTALQETNQSGAYEILNTNDDNKFNPDAFPIDSFAKSISHKILIVRTLDCDLSFEKIKNNPSIAISDEPINMKICTDEDDIKPIVVEHLNTINKHIFITKENISKEQDNEYFRNVMFKHDVFKWSHMSVKFKKKVCSHTIEFMNSKITFEQLGEKAKMKLSTLFDYDETFGIALIKDETPNLLKETFPRPLMYYIPRKVEERCRISSSKLKEFCRAHDDVPDIFIFHGLTEGELSKFLPKMTNTTTSQINQKSVETKYLQLVNFQDFDKICELTSAPVHLISSQDQSTRNLMWKTTRGDINNLRVLVDDNQGSFNEDDFASMILEAGSSKSVKVFHLRGPICVFDSPGMGKTELVLNIVRTLQEKKCYGIYIQFPKFIEVVKFSMNNTDKVLQKSAIIDAISFIVWKYRLPTSIFHSITHLHIGHFILDGYDEVNAADLNLADSIIALINGSVKFIKLYVTTRRHFCMRLEGILGVLSFKILPFQQTDAISFLTTLWLSQAKIEGKTAGLSKTRLTKYAQECLNYLNKELSNGEKSKMLAGYPLQCYLIGRVNKIGAFEFSASENDLPEPSFTNASITSVLKLFEKAFEEIVKQNAAKHSLKGLVIEEVYISHAEYAIQYLYPDLKLRLTNDPDNLLMYGLLQRSSFDLQPSFLHCTFADYFLAKFIYDQLHVNDDETNLWQKVIQTIFKTKKSYTDFFVRAKTVVPIDIPDFEFLSFETLKFFNAMLQNNDCNKESLVKNIVDYLPKENIIFVSFACVRHEFLEICKLILSSNRVELSDHIFIEDLLLRSVQHGELDIFLFVLKHFKENCKPNEQLHHVTVEDYGHRVIVTILHIAIAWGKFKIVENLLKVQKFNKLLKEKRLQMLLHYCTRYSSTDNSTVIENKIKIIDLLHELDSNLVFEKCRNLRTPLDYHNIHTSLFWHIYGCMKDTNRKLPIGLRLLETMKPELGLFISPMQFFSIGFDDPSSIVNFAVENRIELSNNAIKLIGETSFIPRLVDSKAQFNYVILQGLQSCDDIDYLRKLAAIRLNFKVINDKGKNLLHVLQTSATPEFVQHLINLGVDVNLKDSEGFVPLCYALKNNLEKVLLHKLFTHTSEKQCSYTEEKLTLVHIATKAGNIKGLEYLLQNDLKCVINTRDKLNNTPLFSAITSDSIGLSKKQQLITALLNNGATVNKLDKDDDIKSFLKCYSDRMSLKTIQHLIDLCKPISSDLAACLLRHVMSGFDSYNDGKEQQTIELLVSKTDFGLKDEDGNSFLHLAAKIGTLKGVQLAIENIIDVNGVNNSKKTPFHLVRKDSPYRHEILKLLLKEGANINLMDNNKNTARFVQMKHVFQNFSKNVFIWLWQLPFLQEDDIKNMIEFLINDCGTLKETFGEIIPMFLQYNAKIVNFVSRVNKRTLLHMCCMKGWATNATFLINHKANANLQDSSGNTALHYVFMFKHTTLDLVKDLIENGADINIQNASKKTPLECHLMHTQNVVSESLFRFIRGRIYLSDSIIKNCLNHVTSNGRREHIRLLNAMEDVGINVKGYMSVPLILNCIHNSGLMVIRYLHRIGYDFSKKDETGNVFLHCLERVSPCVYHYILEYFVSVGYNSILLHPNNVNETPLHVAVRRFNLMDCSLQLYKTNGANFEAIDLDETSIIVSAALGCRSMKFINELANAGAKIISLFDPKWISKIFHPNIMQKNIEYLKLLVEHEKDINIIDDHGNTLLHVALMTPEKPIEELCNGLLQTYVSEINYEEVIVTLLNNGAEPRAENFNSQIPIEVASPRVLSKLSNETRYRLGETNNTGALTPAYSQSWLSRRFFTN